MSVQSISAINTKKTVDIFSHKLTKASLDAPVQEALTEADSLAVRANYFPYSANINKIETKSKNIIKDRNDNRGFISQTALACEFPKENH